MIDHIDLGCGVGGSINWAKSRFKASSHLGIDNNRDDLKVASDSGYNVMFSDIESDDFEIPKCRFITALHLFEHLKDESSVQCLLDKCVSSATDFVFFKQPYFDADDYLKELGLKLSWSDWIGHPTKVTTDMIIRLVGHTGKAGYVGYTYPYQDSADKFFIPYDAPTDTIYYDASLGSKDIIPLKDVYRETYCFVNVNCSYWDSLVNTDVR